MKLETTGELRSYLASMMLEVKDGTLEVNKARKITNLAGQINGSFYAEVKVAKLYLQTGKSMPPLGETRIGREFF